jgi:alpha-ketoglutarate-dependent taurine dioxygenase
VTRSPELTKVRITYATHWRPNTATHPLLPDDPRHGPVLRYRSALDTNMVHGPLPSNMAEADLYDAVEAALDEALVIAHRWRPGDLLIVNNRTMIHSRQPFEGQRRMVRYRYDDPNFKTVIIGG